MIKNTNISRDSIVTVGSWIGGGIGTIITVTTGVGVGVSMLVGNGVSSFGGFITGTIYDTPTSNLINPYK